MAKIDTYNLSTLLSFEYEAVLLSKNMAISIMMPLFLAIFTVLHCKTVKDGSRMKKHLNSYYLKK